MKISKFLFFFLIVLPLSAVAAEASLISTRVLKNVDGYAMGIALLADGRIFLLSSKAIFAIDSEGENIIGSHRFGIAEVPLRVDAADLDGDGAEEIIVTSVEAGRPSSYIFGFKDDNAFSVISEDVPYFFRVVEDGLVKVLIGQASSNNAAFAGDIHLMMLNGKEVKRVGKIDLPRGIGLYDFAEAGRLSLERVWVRDDSGRIKLFEKDGRKWKTTYKTSERYKSGVNCFPFKKTRLMTESVDEVACIKTPIEVFAAGIVNPNELLLVDRQMFLVGGVLLEPGVPKKSYLYALTFNNSEGVMECRYWGPYQGWISDYFSDGRRQKIDSRRLVLLRNSGRFKWGLHASTIDIGSVDCKGEM